MKQIEEIKYYHTWAEVRVNMGRDAYNTVRRDSDDTFNE